MATTIQDLARANSRQGSENKSQSVEVATGNGAYKDARKVARQPLWIQRGKDGEELDRWEPGKKRPKFVSPLDSRESPIARRTAAPEQRPAAQENDEDAAFEMAVEGIAKEMYLGGESNWKLQRAAEEMAEESSRATQRRQPVQDEETPIVKHRKSLIIFQNGSTFPSDFPSFHDIQEKVALENSKCSVIAPNIQEKVALEDSKCSVIPPKVTSRQVQYASTLLRYFLHLDAGRGFEDYADLRDSSFSSLGELRSKLPPSDKSPNRNHYKVDLHLSGTEEIQHFLKNKHHDGPSDRACVPLLNAAEQIIPEIRDECIAALDKVFQYERNLAEDLFCYFSDFEETAGQSSNVTGHLFQNVKQSHGEFVQALGDPANGRQPQCLDRIKATRQEFINSFRKLHKSNLFVEHCKRSGGQDLAVELRIGEIEGSAERADMCVKEAELRYAAIKRIFEEKRIADRIEADIIEYDKDSCAIPEGLTEIKALDSKLAKRGIQPAIYYSNDDEKAERLTNEHESEIHQALARLAKVNLDEIHDIGHLEIYQNFLTSLPKDNSFVARAMFWRKSEAEVLLEKIGMRLEQIAGSDDECQIRRRRHQRMKISDLEMLQIAFLRDFASDCEKKQMGRLSATCAEIADRRLTDLDEACVDTLLAAEVPMDRSDLMSLRGFLSDEYPSLFALHLNADVGTSVDPDVKHAYYAFYTAYAAADDYPISAGMAGASLAMDIPIVGDGILTALHFRDIVANVQNKNELRDLLKRQLVALEKESGRYDSPGVRWKGFCEKVRVRVAEAGIDYDALTPQRQGEWHYWSVKDELDKVMNDLRDLIERGSPDIKECKELIRYARYLNIIKKSGDLKMASLINDIAIEAAQTEAIYAIPGTARDVPGGFASAVAKLQAFLQGASELALPVQLTSALLHIVGGVANMHRNDQRMWNAKLARTSLKNLLSEYKDKPAHSNAAHQTILTGLIAHCDMYASRYRDLFERGEFGSAYGSLMMILGVSAAAAPQVIIPMMLALSVGQLGVLTARFATDEAFGKQALYPGLVLDNLKPEEIEWDRAIQDAGEDEEKKDLLRQQREIVNAMIKLQGLLDNIECKGDDWKVDQRFLLELADKLKSVGPEIKHAIDLMSKEVGHAGVKKGVAHALFGEHQFNFHVSPSYE